VLTALNRFLDGRDLIDLATRRNMVLLCHTILHVILWDVDVISTPARHCAPIMNTTFIVADTVDSAGVAPSALLF
jgi:hypothetical protein